MGIGGPAPMGSDAPVPGVEQRDALGGGAPVPHRPTVGTGAPRTVRASVDDKHHAEHVLLERLRTSGGWIGTTDLCRYLEQHSAWGRYGSEEARRRTLQNWLRKVRALPKGSRGFEYRGASGGGFEYRRDTRSRTVLASACMALLAERLLEPLLPTDYIRSDLDDRFRAARECVAENERRLGHHGHAVGQLIERIAVAPRGQRLVRERAGCDMAATVTHAILRRLEADYNGRVRRLHPYGLIFREPKYYLLAAEEADLAAGPTPPLKLFVCSRFDTLAVDEAANRVPDAFVVADWIDAGGLDVPLQRVDPVMGRRFELVLRVHATTGNLLRDLADFPLAAGQSIEPEGDGSSGCSVLRVPRQRATEALLEWILGRAEGVEVLEPAFLRAAVGERIEAMAARYRDAAPRSPGTPA